MKRATLGWRDASLDHALAPGSSTRNPSHGLLLSPAHRQVFFHPKYLPLGSTVAVDRGSSVHACSTIHCGRKALLNGCQGNKTLLSAQLSRQLRLFSARAPTRLEVLTPRRLKLGRQHSPFKRIWLHYIPHPSIVVYSDIHLHTGVWHAVLYC